MGCWGFGIMQSDDALDAEIFIMEAAELNWEEKDSNKVQKKFAKHYQDIVSVCEGNGSDYDNAVYWQVFAVLGMRHGFNFLEDQQKQVIEGISRCNEYCMGKNFGSDPVKLKTAYELEYGEGSMKQQDEIFGENSSIYRIMERTKNIDQLISDFKSFCNAGFKPFERNDAGLIETFQKKLKM